MDDQVTMLSELKDKLEEIQGSPVTKKVFIGFDGFVDTIMKAVKQKMNFETTYFATIKDFAARIKSASGKSGQIELVKQRVKLGGNGPILSNSLARLGVRSFCAGALGYPDRHDVFLEMDRKSELISLQNPGKSSAIEFDDGKIIMSELSVFEEFDWNFVKNSPHKERIRKAVLASNIVAFVDWVNLPHSSDIWEGVLHEIIKPSGRKDFYFLFDLCDPSKKTDAQIDEILDVISSFSPYGKVTLGLNENETLKIWCAIKGVDYNNPAEKDKIPSVRSAGDALYKAINIDYLLVHPIDRTIVFHQHEIVELKGRLVTKPKVLTGGGDNLNAGYCLGLLNELSLQHCMLLGMATSGAYIQNGITPDLKSLSEYVQVWIDELSQEPVKPQQEFAHRHE